MSPPTRPVDLRLRIESHEPLGASHFLLTLASDHPLPSWEPGQFAMIAVGQERGVVDPLLRRPFSIFNLPGSPRGCMQFFYKVLGRGTELLSHAPPGGHLRCLAPLGNGFDAAGPGLARTVLVAGGIGSASLHPLALRSLRSGRAPLVLYGCRTAEELAGIRPTQEAGADVRIATDDGSAGVQGVVSELLDRHLAEEGPASRDRWSAIACGPMAMMKATAAVARRHGVACHVSLESPMACGFGVCVGCVVATREKADSPLRYRRICVEGPVFDATQVVW